MTTNTLTGPVRPLGREAGEPGNSHAKWTEPRGPVTLDKRHPLLLSLLGEDEDGFYESAAACARMATGPKTAKALTIRTLGAVLAAWEDSAGVHTWRNPNEWDARVMGALIGWGYEASDVERILIGEEPTTDDAN